MTVLLIWSFDYRSSINVCLLSDLNGVFCLCVIVYVESLGVTNHSFLSIGLECSLKGTLS